jgi:hypothetical protein
MTESLNPGDKLKAKCPKCENGCSECENGYIEVSFGSKDMVMYALVCNVCDGSAGGGFEEPGKPHKISEYARCPHCGGSNLRKEYLDGESS